MRRARDNQVKSVYTAEIAYPYFREGQLDTLANVHGFVDDIIKQPWFIGQFPHILNVKVTPRRKGVMRSGANFEVGIKLGSLGFNKYTVLHELCHVCQPLAVQAHGKEFAGIHLFLVYHVLGDTHYNALLAKYKEYKVKVEHIQVVPVRKRTPRVQRTLDKILGCNA